MATCAYCGKPLHDPEWTYCSTKCADTHHPPKWWPRVHEPCMTPFGERVKCVGVYFGALGQDAYCEVQYLDYGYFPKGATGKYPLSEMMPTPAIYALDSVT